MCKELHCKDIAKIEEVDGGHRIWGILALIEMYDESRTHRPQTTRACAMIALGG